MIKAETSKRLQEVDIAKGIGIILVVLCHLIQGLFRRGLFPYPGLYTAVNHWIYAFHMPLFFTIAGMLVDSSIKKRGRRAVLEARLESLIYPYLVWSILQVVAKRAFSGEVNVETGWADLLWIWCTPLEHLWFLYALFICYALYLGLFRFKDAALGLGVVLYAASPWITHELSFKVASFFLYFALGATLKEMLMTPALPLILGVFTTAQWLQGPFYPFSLLPLKVVAALAGTAATLKVSGWLADTQAARSLRVLGRDSLAIYLLHPYGTVMWRMIMTRLHWLAQTPFLAPVGLFMALVFGLLGGRAVKRFHLPLFNLPIRK